MVAYAQFKKQRYQEKPFQLSLFPGISTHGIHEAWYFNKFSLNLLGGISAGSKHFELAGISNLSIRYTTGIQIAGIANVVGSNAFVNLSLGEERELINEEAFTSYFKGFQIAGYMNYVRNDATGLQLAGAFNVSGGTVTGIQWAGVSNVAQKDMIGLQLSGLTNTVIQSAAGWQISTLFNNTKGIFTGLQLGLINRNHGMVGKRSTAPNNKGRSLQLGVINSSKRMDGVQIGLINFGNKANGTQIGLINFFSTKPSKDSRKSVLPIGLLNFGSKGGFWRFANNELFLYSIEKSTGNCSNCSATQYEMPMLDDYQKFNQNILSFSYNPSGFRLDRPYWSVGYAFERLNYIKRSMFPKKRGPQNKSHYFSWGVKVQHLNWEQEFDTALSLQTSIYGSYGKRVNLKFLGIVYLYFSIRINDYITENQDNGIINNWMLVKVDGEKVTNRIWPGYSIGIQI